MRPLLFAAATFLLISCNSGDNKDPNQAMDDTARMRNPPVQPHAPSIEAIKLDAADIPAMVKIKGKLHQAWKWNDQLGENILVTSFNGPYNDKNKTEDGEEGQSAELFALHYAGKPGEYKVITTFKEREISCPFDITAGFIPGSITITDLDKDGIAEFKLQYLLACRSDVSPATMKLALYENGKKYGLTGLSWIRYSPEFKFNVSEKDVNLAALPPLTDDTEDMLRRFGRYENEKDFAEAPVEFIAYARKEWLKHVMEKMGE